MSIYKKQSEDSKTFETPEEFLKYYENNKKDIDETHTRSLNLKYKINNHRIGRKLGKIILYPIQKGKNDEEDDFELKQQFENLEEKYNKLKTVVLQLIEEIETLKNFHNGYSTAVTGQDWRQSTSQLNFQNYTHK